MLTILLPCKFISLGKDTITNMLYKRKVYRYSYQMLQTSNYSIFSHIFKSINYIS